MKTEYKRICLRNQQQEDYQKDGFEVDNVLQQKLVQLKQAEFERYKKKDVLV